jgi:hypothetical protein
MSSSGAYPFPEWLNTRREGRLPSGANGEQKIFAEPTDCPRPQRFVVTVMSKLSDGIHFVVHRRPNDVLAWPHDAGVSADGTTLAAATPHRRRTWCIRGDYRRRPGHGRSAFCRRRESGRAKADIYNPAKHLDLKLKRHRRRAFHEPTSTRRHKDDDDHLLKESAARATRLYDETWSRRSGSFSDPVSSPEQPLVRKQPQDLRPGDGPKAGNSFVDLQQDQGRASSAIRRGVAWKVAHPQTGSPPAGTPHIRGDELRGF